MTRSLIFEVLIVDHIGIDIGSRESQVCVRNDAGEVIEEVRCKTGDLSSVLAGRAKSRVIVETCTEAFRIADAAIAEGHEVRVVPATLVRSLGVGQRRIKNDERDARVLSEASSRIELPSVHIPSTTSREWKALSTSREALVRARTQLISTIRCYVRSRRSAALRATPESLPPKIRTALLGTEGGLPEHIERVLVVLESLNEQIAAAAKELAELAENNELTRRLMTTPGVGPVTAVRFVAAIDKVERFPSGTFVASYLGLTPGENTTGFRTKRTRLTKAGAPEVRWALGQAAWSIFLQRKESPMARWAKQVAARRGRQVAITALARKLSQVLYALWRDGTTYSSEKARVH
jgi:transposase